MLNPRQMVAVVFGFISMTCFQTVFAITRNILTPFHISAYLPDYRMQDDFNLNDTVPFLTDLMLFSAQPSEHVADDDSSQTKMLSSCCVQPRHFELARQARSYKLEQSSSQLKLWLTIGGGGRSDHFLKNLPNLTIAIGNLAVKESLDGIDLDCEFFRNSADFRKYASWIRNAADHLHSKGLFVSVALHPGQMLPADLYQRIDRIHLMTYDLPGKTYHAEITAVTRAIDTLIDSGCPRDKILIGIPAYARHEDHPEQVKTFAELIDMKQESSGESVYEELDTFAEHEGYRGNSPALVREKVLFAQETNVGGVFLWELGQDKRIETVAKGGVLLEAISGQTFSTTTEQHDEL